jgi:hypothetical protein
MKCLIIGLLAFAIPGAAAADTYVQGHFRSDGTYVPGHFRPGRASPDWGGPISTPVYGYRAPRIQPPTTTYRPSYTYRVPHPRTPSAGPRLPSIYGSPSPSAETKTPSADSFDY